MASITSELTVSRLNSRSEWRGKVRIVGKIRAWSDLETKASNGDSSPWISVQRPKEGESSDFVTVSFGDQLIRVLSGRRSQKDSYKLDYCYEQGEEAAQLFSREVRPLLSGVFEGLSASVLAYGARGSGKTFLMQGMEEKPGLGPLALAEILSIGEGIGGLVAVSCYEVYQDHIYDLLEQNRQEVPVKTLPELYKLYGQGSTSHNPAQRGKNDVSRRSHKGLIIYVSHENKDSGVSTTGKINFVDLAGYVDTKRKSIDGSNLVESGWINKSLYTLQNVVKALNGRERVPYRESKLTGMLQDSFEGKSQSLMEADRLRQVIEKEMLKVEEERALRSLGRGGRRRGRERSGGGEEWVAARRRRDSARVGRRARESRGVVHVAVEEVGVSVASGADGGDVGVEEEIRGGGRSGGGGGGGGGCGGAEVVDGGADCGGGGWEVVGDGRGCGGFAGLDG
ncbi:hypothetical protein Syun_013169 [Stephania yunnanensis]|uniref:Kinesin motor domain-containing protein n=1 Tax=Stephania yunnanensis TaxID=152371 RepID=A0AAP0PIB2_9MAGN